jgi:hypothetical protein
VEICTIGFTKKSAAQFFGTLKKADVKQLVDVRLNNVSQLAGFTKRDDLEFFLRELCDAAYRHEPLLAPTQTLLDSYKKRQLPWGELADQQRRQGYGRIRRLDARICVTSPATTTSGAATHAM